MRQKHEDGNILFYILIAVALLGALSYVVTRGGGDSASGTSATKISEEIRNQAQIIRAAVMECVLVHNFGYPEEPAAPGLVKDLECQTADTPTVEKQLIFGGAQNRFLPLPPKPFVTGWIYTIDTGTTPHTISLSLEHSTNCTTNAGLKAALNILANSYSDEEADTTCTAGTAGFRLYLVKPNS